MLARVVTKRNHIGTLRDHSGGLIPGNSQGMGHSYLERFDCGNPSQSVFFAGKSLAVELYLAEAGCFQLHLAFPFVDVSQPLARNPLQKGIRTKAD